VTRILRIELRRSAAAGTALVLLLIGAALLYADPQRWAAGWMPLAIAQRETLVLTMPLALAAGAWQARREHRSHVAELIASTARPRAQRVTPILAAFAIAVAAGYLAVAAAAVPWIAGTARYLPANGLIVLAVGALALIAAAWLGLAAGRLLPSPITAPALAVAGLGVLMLLPAATGHREWLAQVFAPTRGMGLFTPYPTVPGGVSVAQTIWLAALAATALVLLAAGSRRARAAALLPAVLGAAVTVLVAPSGSDFVDAPMDTVARELVCADGTPQVCVSRIHAGLLPEVTPLARRGLTMLAKLPNAPVGAAENINTFADENAQPQRPDTVLLDIDVDSRGHLAGKADFLPRMLNAAGVDTRACAETLSAPVSRAAAYWLMDLEPGLIDTDAETHTLWQGLRILPEAEAAVRVAAVRRAALDCQNLDGLLTTGNRG
jgi:hypothetical protein